MAKNKSFSLWHLVATLFGIAAVAMCALKAVNIVGKLTELTHYSATGIQATFGYTDGSLSVFSFSVFNLIAYILVIVATVLVCLKAFGLVKSNVVDLLAICMFVIAGVFFFLMPTFSVSEYATDLSSLVTKNLGIGAILSGAFSLVSACLMLIKLALKK